MKILITGATGGIGSAIKEELYDHELTCIPHADIQTDEEFDWLICAHGVINEEDMLETFIANVLTNIRLTQTIKTKNIIFISSTAALKGNDQFPIYSASKAALNTYAKSIAKNINCYILCLGPTDTPLWRRLGLEGNAQSPKSAADVVSKIINSAGIYGSGDIIIVRNGEIV